MTGGGKGPLLSPEKSLTLSCNNDQVLFDSKAQCLTSGTGRRYDPETETLVPVMLENHSGDSRVKIDESGKSQTLTSRMGTGGGNVPMLMEPVAIQHSVIGRKPEAGAQGPGFRDDGKMFTLDSRGSAHAIAFQPGNLSRQAGAAPSTEVFPTLGATTQGDQFPHVAFAVNQRDEVRDLGQKSGAIQAQPGMKQQTFIAEPIAFNGDQSEKTRSMGEAVEQSPTLRAGGSVHVAYAIRTAQTSSNGWGITEETSYTLDLASGQAVCYPEPANTLLAKANMSYRGDTDNVVRMGYAVRRLTPTECERLQGMPDQWTEGGSDSKRYKAIGNSLARPCSDFVMMRIKAIYDIESR